MGRGEPGVLERLLGAAPSPVGEPWYEAERQRGVLLPDLGPGLLIATAKDPAADESGAIMVDVSAIVTIYGLDDDAFDGERRRWEAWWRSAYPDAQPAQV